MAQLEPLPMRYRVHTTALPKGWFCVADSDEISAQAMKPVTFLNQAMVVYRTPHGEARVADAFCPHLGAHLASYDGCIVDGQIVCPFHKWRFDASTGRVAAIPYSKTIPPAVGLRLYEVRELDGMILIWYHPTAASPDHEPFSSPELRSGSWMLHRKLTWTATCVFRDILENIFDTAHAQQLHRATDVPTIAAIEPRPHGLLLEYVQPPRPGSIGIERIEYNFSGVSLTTLHFSAAGFSTVFVLSFTPIDIEQFVQRGRLYISETHPRQQLDQFAKVFCDGFAAQVEQDFAVLNYKKHLPRPALCAGDGPIHRFRTYADQYYV